MTLFELVGKIMINNDEANEKLEETKGKTSSFSEKLKSGIGTVAKWGTAIVGGATAVVGGLAKAAESSASAADNIDKMSQKIGISREAYQELDFICSQSGMSVDTLQAGMKSLTSAMDGAANGTASNVEQFEKLGVSVTNADGSFRSQEEVMWDTMAALQSMDNQTEKARLATELFGRSGTELMPLLNGASGSIDEMKQQAHDLGLVLDDETIDSGVSLTDTLDQMKRSLSAVGTKLGAALMPVLEKFCNLIIDNMPLIQSIVEQIIPIITQLFEKLVPPLLELAEQLLPVIASLITALLPTITQIITAILPVITELLTMLLPPIMQIVEMILPLLVSLLEPLLPLLQPLLELLQPFIDLLLMLLQPLIDLLNMILPPLVQALSELITNILPPLKDAFSGVANVLGAAFQVSFEAIQPLIDSLMTAFGGLIDFIKGVFTGDWKKAWNGIVTFFKGIWDTIWDIVKGVVNLIIDGINSLWSGIYSAVKGIVDSIGSVAGALGDLFGQDWHFSMPEEPPLIPKLAEGGIVNKATHFIAGEDGQEAVIPLEKNTGWMDSLASRINSQKPQSSGQTVIINIQNFINNTDKDIDELTDIMDKKLSKKIARSQAVNGHAP